MSEGNGPVVGAGAISEVLRHAGHGAAADLLDKINAINATRVADEADQPRPAAERQPPAAERQPTAADPEVARQAEGAYLLQCSRRDLPDLAKKREDR
jgi:hypothetical protein